MKAEAAASSALPEQELGAAASKQLRGDSRMANGQHTTHFFMSIAAQAKEKLYGENDGEKPGRLSLARPSVGLPSISTLQFTSAARSSCSQLD